MLRVLLALLLLPVALVGGLLLLLNTSFGATQVESLTARFTGGMVTLAGVGGTIPQAPRVKRIELRDRQGVWLTLDDVELDWSPSRLLQRDAQVDRLDVGRVAVARLPVSDGPAAASSSGFSLPVRVDVDRLHVARIEVAAAVAGTAASLSAEGSAHLAALSDGQAALTLARLDAPGTYTLNGRADAQGLAAEVVAREPAGGLIAAVAKLPDVGALAVQAHLDGPWSGIATDVGLAAGELRATAKGRVDLVGRAADLDLTATAPAMRPAPEVAWQAVALEAHVHGPFATPQATGTFRLEGVAAAGAAVRLLTAEVSGDRGQVALTARAEGLVVPGPRPALLAGAPVVLDAGVRLDAADRPVRFHLAHPLLDAQGVAHTGGDLAAEATLTLPDLAPLAAIGGVDLQGRTALRVQATRHGDLATATVDGTVGVTGGLAPLPALIGPAATVGATAAVRGGDVTLSRLEVAGAKLRLGANGGIAAGVIGLDWTVALPELQALAASVQGAVQARGRVAGPADDFALQAEIDGDLGTAGFARAPVRVAVQAQGLPGKPAGQVAAQATLEGSPLTLDATATREGGVLRVDIRRAGWKSATAEGAVTLAEGATLPDGKLALKVQRLADLSALAGQPLAGALAATLELSRGTARLVLDAQNAGAAGSGAARAKLDATVADVMTKPLVRASLAIDGVRAGTVAGGARLELDGPETALALRLSTTLQNFQGGDLQGIAAGTLDVPALSLALASLQATWKGQALRLLAPARITLEDGFAVDRLRLGLQQAVLELAGRFSPTLDLTATLRGVTPDLARPFVPDLQADGTLTADARITGTPLRPAGTVRLNAAGLRMRTGPGRALPPATIAATATLAGEAARIDTRVTAGSNALSVTGTAPLAPGGALNLRAAGTIDLAAADPVLAAGGRRVRGRLALDAGVTGTLAAPRATGTLRLSGGDVQDFALGARVDNLAAVVQADGATVRIASLSGRAGAGTISASGTVGLAAPMPVDLGLALRRASPLSGERLRAVLDGDLMLRGALQGRLAVGGALHIASAEIRVPETLPTSVAVLNVRRPGDKPPPPPSPGPDIGLDLGIDSPGQIFVRGRGLDAELSGMLRIGGTAAAPQPSGSFKMRRGTFSLAGQSLTFTSGEVGFDGSGKIDPSLNFVATSVSGNVTATLTVSGYASKPVITLSSVPEVPQDEVLARLLFHQSAASLGPFQLAAIAAALAQISGVGGAGSFDPLDRVRSGLGLDRLSVGGGTGNSATVEAGKYVAQGVYVGAKQSTGGAGTQATVQVDLYRGLKAEADVGTGGGSATGSSSSGSSSGTSVGLTYQFEY